MHIKTLILALFFFPFIVNAQTDFLSDPKADSNLDLKAPESFIFEYEQVKDTKNQDIIKYSFTSSEVPEQPGEDINKRTNNSQTFKIGDNKYQTKIYPGEPFKKEGDKWLQVENATTTLKAWTNQYKISSLDKMKNWLFPRARADDIFVGSADGYIVNGWVGTWSGARDAVSGTADSTSAGAKQPYSGRSGSTYMVGRVFLPFNTSSIGSGNTIDSASVFVYKPYHDDSHDGLIGIVASSMTDPTSLSGADFDNITFDFISNTIHTDTSATGYHEFVLSDLSPVDPAGWTKLALITDYDESNIPPGVDTFYRFPISFSEESGTSQDPYISVLYTETPPEPTPTPTAEPEFIGTSTPYWNIENIHYIATTTVINASTTVITGMYTIPFFDYLIVLFTFCFSIFVIWFIYSLFIKRRR